MASVPSIARLRTATQPDITRVTLVDGKYAGKDGKAQIARNVNDIENHRRTRQEGGGLAGGGGTAAPQIFAKSGNYWLTVRQNKFGAGGGGSQDVGQKATAPLKFCRPCAHVENKNSLR